MARSKPSWKPWGDHPIVVTIVVITALLGLFFAMPPLINQNQRIEYWGRVLDSKMEYPIRSAKITLEFQDAPSLVYTDTEGVYRFLVTLNEGKAIGRIHVYVEGYTPYNRYITLSPDLLQLEDIRLTPMSISTIQTTPNLSTSVILGGSATVVPIPKSIPFASPLDSNTLNTSFHSEWNNLTGNRYTLLPQSNILSITAAPRTEQWEGKSETNTAPMIVYPIQDDFEAQVKVIFQPASAKQVAGLGVRSSNNRYTWLRIAKDHIPQIILCLNQEGTAGCANHVNYTLEVAHFKIKRSGTYFTLYFSEDGNSWTILQQDYEFEMPREVEIYLFTYSTNDESITAHFSDFRIVKE